jgi:hypothetical protein
MRSTSVATDGLAERGTPPLMGSAPERPLGLSGSARSGSPEQTSMALRTESRRRKTAAKSAPARQQNIEILRRWEYDASEACVATEEGMPDGESDLLRRILLALEQLSAEIDLDQVGPTKQHGIPRSAVRSK